ncbi:MAG: rhodanese-like domain-containing protein [Rhodospirillales bacterium]|nr:rhodanese-like domain-containing protein [Rhodospirillales bacterium]
MLRSALLITTLLAISTTVHAEVSDIDSAVLERLVASGVPVIDIRTPEEWRETGVIEGSYLQTFFDEQGRYDARAWMAAIESIAASDQPVVLICRSGGRSSAVGRLLTKQFDYRRVYNVHAGIAQWIAEGRPTVPHR